jgi:hypothetical protein
MSIGIWKFRYTEQGRFNFQRRDFAIAADFGFWQ